MLIVNGVGPHATEGAMWLHFELDGRMVQVPAWADDVNAMKTVTVLAEPIIQRDPDGNTTTITETSTMGFDEYLTAHEEEFRTKLPTELTARD